MAMRMSLEEAPEGTIGVDMNQRITPDLAKALFRRGYQFAVRYVRRVSQHDFDLSFDEVTDILRSGLGLMVVQHVANEGWMPNRDLGRIQGRVAADEVGKLHLPSNIMVWCDLEGVSPEARFYDVVDFCNAWWEEVSRAKLFPGLYVGYSPGISAIALYRNLKFTRYWSAYNLNADEYPWKRGVCMKQSVAKPEDRVPGLELDGFDLDVVQKDLLGGLPLILFGRGQ